jgi:hypothetical protein
MKTGSGVVVLCAVLFAALSAGCSSGDDSGGSSNCSEPIVDGPTFFVGSATVHGAGTLPAGSPDGDALELFLDNQTGMYDLIAPPGSSRVPATCGRTFMYTVRDLAGGTYGFSYRLVPSGSSTPVATGSSPQTFTIADGEDLEVDPTF